ncbi:TPA: dTDP-4-dehydrorhamnose 3,5-epimerase, partial [Citrobacter farmeri]|nr:dTDP-4-dehydrorhamnose 3,5-epimerase [Citrobacter farmeri]
MNVVRTDIPDVLILEPTIYSDERGFFFESFNQRAFEDIIGYKINFVQDNHSKSTKGVLRGLHYQSEPYAQGKLVRCIIGEVYDVAVDIRKSSTTFGQWVGIRLSAENKRQLWIPEGFAHGFLVLSEVAEFLYKTTNFYKSDCEGCIAWDDVDLGINWPKIEREFILSAKDKHAGKLCNI